MSITYWQRKRAEVGVLARAAGVPPPEVSTSAQLVAAKQALRARLLARTIAEAPALTESNLGGGPPDLAWKYMRFDLRWRRKPFVNSVHPSLRVPCVSLGLYTGSGMAAVSAALMGLDAIAAPGQKALFAVDAYFETLLFAARHLRTLRLSHDAPADANIVHLDSISCDAPVLPDGAAWVLLDTTCWDEGSPRVAALVEACVAARTPLLLVRSHLKLDCLGSEYARLGSLAVVLPPRPETATVRAVRRLRARAIEWLALTGGGLEPHARWPLADDPEARALNAARNEAIFAAHARAAAQLVGACSPTGVTAPHHRCFLILRPVLDGKWQVAQYLAELRAALADAGVDARAAPSFGYDFTALTQLDAPRGPSAIRLALGDLPDDEVDRLCRAVIATSEAWLPTR
jgi:hypothetical protein